MSLTVYIILGVITFLAGIMDGAMGGGGLIQVPAIQILYPQFSWMQIFAVNKTMSSWGTGVAFSQYASHVATPSMRKRLIWTMPLSAMASVLGVGLIQFINKGTMRWLVIMLLAGVAAYVFYRPNLGKYAADDKEVKSTPWWKWSLVLPIAAYDGFFGPGTGAFALFGSLTVLRLSFLQAQVVAKAWNFASNIGALLYFIYQGFWYPRFIPLALINIGGNWLGSRIVLYYGDVLIRRLFLGVIILLIGHLLHQAYIS